LALAKLRLVDRVMPANAAARVADAGCGSGVISSHLAQTARHVVGFDANPAAIAFAARAWPQANLRFVLGPFEEMIAEGPFDQVYCLEVLEHLYEEQAVEVLRLFAMAASRRAELLVTTPNANSAWPVIEWTLDRLHLVATLAEAQHVTIFTKRRLAQACTAAGWVVEEMGSFNGVAPFLAAAGEPLALATERLEFATRRILPWNLLYCRARKSETG